MSSTAPLVQPVRATRPLALTSWVVRLLAAAILAQTLVFKFSGAPESVALFQQLGAEPWGRWATGLAEAVAVVLLLVPRTAAYGGLLTLGLMTGALGSHLTTLGVEVQGDGGLLFGLAVTTFVAAGLTVLLHRDQLPRLPRP